MGENSRNKPNDLLEEVNTKESIDYSNQEILEIKTAVHKMLESIVTRVNNRAMFKIYRIEPCGSMIEKNAVWKYDKKTEERYTESDFLAVLVHYPVIGHRDYGCVSMRVNYLYMRPHCTSLRLVSCFR